MKRTRQILISTTALSALLLAAPAARAEVKAQVLQIKMKLTEQNLTQVHLQGIVRNTDPLPVRDVKIRVQLLDPQHKPVRSFLLDPFEHLESGQTNSFQADYLLRDYTPLYVEASADLTYTPTSYFQIADWILSRNWRNLELWQIPLTQTLKNAEREQVETAVNYLEKVPSSAGQAYTEARRKINLTQYNYGKRLADSGSLHEAILRLANVEADSEHGQEAQDLVDTIRNQTIFKRAMDKAVRGHYRAAYRQMMYIPESSDLYAKAQAKQAEWLEILKAHKIWLGPISPPPYLSRDQRSVWLRRQHGPEGFTTSVHADGSRLKTWWYLDYSYYTFDAQGKLLNKHEY